MTAQPVVVLVDDARDFRDGRATHTARSSHEALRLLGGLGHVDELWLDYDLIGDDTAQPVVDHLVALAAAGSPYPVGKVLVHSSNVTQGHRVAVELAAVGYPATRSFARIFKRAPLAPEHTQVG